MGLCSPLARVLIPVPRERPRARKSTRRPMLVMRSTAVRLVSARRMRCRWRQRGAARPPALSPKSPFGLLELLCSAQEDGRVDGKSMQPSIHALGAGSA